MTDPVVAGLSEVIVGLRHDLADLTTKLAAAEAVVEAAKAVNKISYDDGPEEIALAAALATYRAKETEG